MALSYNQLPFTAAINQNSELAARYGQPSDACMAVRGCTVSERTCSVPFSTTQLQDSISYALGKAHISIVQELCESGGGRPGLSVLTSLLVSVDVKLY